MDKLDHGFIEKLEHLVKGSEIGGTVVNVGKRDKEPYVRGAFGGKVKTVSPQNIASVKDAVAIVCISEMEHVVDPLAFAGDVIDALGDG